MTRDFNAFEPGDIGRKKHQKPANAEELRAAVRSLRLRSWSLSVKPDEIAGIPHFDPEANLGFPRDQPNYPAQIYFVEPRDPSECWGDLWRQRASGVELQDYEAKSPKRRESILLRPRLPSWENPAVQITYARTPRVDCVLGRIGVISLITERIAVEINNLEGVTSHRYVGFGQLARFLSNHKVLESTRKLLCRLDAGEFIYRAAVLPIASELGISYLDLVFDSAAISSRSSLEWQLCRHSLAGDPSIGGAPSPKRVSGGRPLSYLMTQLCSNPEQISRFWLMVTRRYRIYWKTSLVLRTDAQQNSWREKVIADFRARIIAIGSESGADSVCDLADLIVALGREDLAVWFIYQPGPETGDPDDDSRLLISITDSKANKDSASRARWARADLISSFDECEWLNPYETISAINA